MLHALIHQEQSFFWDAYSATDGDEFIITNKTIKCDSGKFIVTQPHQEESFIALDESVMCVFISMILE